MTALADRWAYRIVENSCGTPIFVKRSAQNGTLGRERLVARAPVICPNGGRGTVPGDGG